VARVPEHHGGATQPEAEEHAEVDVPADEATAGARSTGGVEDPDAPDQASTTGSTPKGEYVGRIAGDDPGYAGETGAEARSDPDR
jgi:hypothetical protein